MADMQMVFYALIQRGFGGDGRQFLVRRIHGSFTFPPTKMEQGDELYLALDRIMAGDLGLPYKSFYPEMEFSVIESALDGPKYEGLSGKWYLYPVVVSLTEKARSFLDKSSPDLEWMTMEELDAATQEPNTKAIIRFLLNVGAEQLAKSSLIPSMDALACYWARFNDGGVRIARGETIEKILDTGDRAFNLRVADPYLPYHKQGLGFTWSFFTPKDKQDLHVHGMPAVEIYGVLKGRLQLWWKPMNARGVKTWKNKTLEAGDWAEVEPLNCHLAAWLTPEGLGTVIKAAGTGELAGVGRLGVSGKTVCKQKNPDGNELKCSNYGHCQIPPVMQKLMDEYKKVFEERDWDVMDEER